MSIIGSFRWIGCGSGFGKTPLSRLESQHSNDDVIERQPDRIHDANVHQIYSQVVINALQKEDISSIHIFHGDTTSKSVYGQHENVKVKTEEEEGNLLITEGCSGAVVNDDGIPIYADVHDGNTSDKTWNPTILNKIKEQLGRIDVANLIYVASAAMTQATLLEAQKAGANLLSQGPKGLNMVKHMLKIADEQPSA